MNQVLTTLNEIGEWGSGGTPFSSKSEFYDGSIPWLVIEDLTDDIVIKSKKFITEMGLKNSSAKMVDPNTLLIAMYGSIGKLGIAGIKCATNQAIAFCKVNSEIADIWFVFYYLLFSRPTLLHEGRGNTQQNISQSFLKDYPIPLPPLPDQQRIAAILQKADRLRRLRRYARQLSDGYLQSVFLEMFEGEREESRKEILGDIAEIASGVTKGQNFKGRKTIEVPYLRVANVQDGYLNLTEIKTIQALPSEVINLHLKIGDILMTEGGDYDKLGRGTIWHGEIDPCIHQNHIFRVRLDDKKLIPEFFDTYLLTRGVKNYFLTASKKTTNLATINMTQLKKLPVIIPPLKEQERFAAIYRHNKHFRNQQSESMRQAEHLFQSLLQRSFQGEL